MAETDIEREKMREDARQAFGAEPSDISRTAETVRSGVIGGIDGIHSVASESVHLVRDVATETVRAVGDVGAAAVDTAHNLLVDVADGLRDVITHIIPFKSDRGRQQQQQPPSERG